MKRPLMIYDGDCEFCQRWIERWRRVTGDRVEYLPYQDVSVVERYPELSQDEFARAVHLIETDGTVRVGAEAALIGLSHGNLRWPLWIYRNIPGMRFLSEWGYRWVANHRETISRLTRGY